MKRSDLVWKGISERFGIQKRCHSKLPIWDYKNKKELASAKKMQNCSFPMNFQRQRNWLQDAQLHSRLNQLAAPRGWHYFRRHTHLRSTQYRRHTPRRWASCAGRKQELGIIGDLWYVLTNINVRKWKCRRNTKACENVLFSRQNSMLFLSLLNIRLRQKYVCKCVYVKRWLQVNYILWIGQKNKIKFNSTVEVSELWT